MASIYVGSSLFDIGVVKQVGKKNVKMTVSLPGISDGEAPETLKLGEDYTTISISCNFHGTLSQINTFEDTLIGYCKSLQVCEFVNTGSTLGNGTECIFYDWAVTQSNTSMAYRQYEITLLEGTKLA